MTTTTGGSDLIAGNAASAIVRAAEQARLPSDVDDLVAKISALAEIDWKPFGSEGKDGDRIPHSAVGAAEDPALLLAEAPMNSFDAHFEQALALAKLAGSPPATPTSPRDAAHLLFGVPAKGVATWDVREGAERSKYQALARMTQVILRTGTSKSLLTIIFRDTAIGQHPEDFWATILSLQMGNKTTIPYTSGQYGHGAGMLLGFCEGGQVMISRRSPKLLKDGQEDYAGLTLVRKRMPSETGNVNPHYECLVSKRSGLPFAVAPSALANPQWHGLHRACVDYELPSTAFQFIYDSFDRFLPHPPLPYELRDERDS